MKRFLILTCALALSVSVAPHCAAGIIPLTIDSTNSFLNLSIDGQTPQPSSASGTATLDLPDHSATSGNAQLTSLDLTLDQGFSFPVQIGFLTAQASSMDGEVSFSLVTPGAPGTIAGGTFDQLGNQLALAGEVELATLLGSTPFDLADVDIPLTDFNNISIAQTGNVISITGTFSIAQELDVLGNIVALDGDGQFVATGIKPVPEPGSSIVLIGMASVLLTRRRR